MQALAAKWRSLKACRDQLRQCNQHDAAKAIDVSIFEIEIELGIHS